MLEELSRRVEELTGEVRGLKFQLSRRTKWVWGTIGTVVLVAAVALGGAYYLIDRNNTRQAAQQLKQGTALCRSWKVQSESDVQPTASEIGRSIVRTASAAYRLIGCEQVTGKLGDVDPDAFKPAPATPAN